MPTAATKPDHLASFTYVRGTYRGQAVWIVRWPGGAYGTVSNDYPDGRWRSLCDRREGDHSYKTRAEAAAAEYEQEVAADCDLVTDARERGAAIADAILGLLDRPKASAVDVFDELQREGFSEAEALSIIGRASAANVAALGASPMVPQVCQQQQAQAARVSAEPQTDKPRKAKKPRAAATYRSARRRAAVTAARKQRKLIRAALKARPLTVELPRNDGKKRQRECARRLRQMQKAAA